ncbi:hypothetical protein NLG97_g6551 [Lecanicillium saksenae]|uniref:Uncharacterized protein n=1 Tax=Lecanicillium saksenae TaxID=468837 RepID=A0ACC1QQY4_9HYPO|nr:hypothetical protein NLG97_g6551 [Lecanicillium saksenae]
MPPQLRTTRTRSAPAAECYLTLHWACLVVSLFLVATGLEAKLEGFAHRRDPQLMQRARRGIRWRRVARESADASPLSPNSGDVSKVPLRRWPLAVPTSYPLSVLPPAHQTLPAVECARKGLKAGEGEGQGSQAGQAPRRHLFASAGAAATAAEKVERSSRAEAGRRLHTPESLLNIWCRRLFQTAFPLHRT